jgi:hypothetical protein
VELDQRLHARGVDELEGVHAKALHVAVVEGHAHVVQQERELEKGVGVGLRGRGKGAGRKQAGGVGAGRRAFGRGPASPHHVERLRVVGEEVRDAPPLLDVVLGVGLEGVNHIGKLDAVADEKHLESGFLVHFSVDYAWIDQRGNVPRAGREEVADPRSPRPANP